MELAAGYFGARNEKWVQTASDSLTADG